MGDANPKIHIFWCGPTSTRFTGSGQPDYNNLDRPIGTADTLNFCNGTYRQACWNASAGQQGVGRQAFHQCCKNCFGVIVGMTVTCTWSANSPSGSVGGTFHWDLDSPTYGSACHDACNMIKTATTADDFCRNSALATKLNAKCPVAAASVLNASVPCDSSTQ